MMSRSAGPRDWELERHRLGELPEGEVEVVRQALEVDETVRARMATLAASDREILAAHPPPVVAAAIRSRLDARTGSEAPEGRAHFRWTRPALAVGAAVVAVAVAVLAPSSRRPETADITRVKGLRPQLLVFRETPPAAVELLAPGSVARANDVVQLAYQAAGRRFGAIVSVDARGVVTRHLPVSGSQAMRLKPQGPTTLDRAYRLDDAPGFERFYLVTAQEPFSVDEVVSVVRGQAAGGLEGGRPLPLPAALDQVTFVLKKEAVR